MTLEGPAPHPLVPLFEEVLEPIFSQSLQDRLFRIEDGLQINSQNLLRPGAKEKI